jgi:hypothetical protein
VLKNPSYFKVTLLLQQERSHGSLQKIVTQQDFDTTLYNSIQLQTLIITKNDDIMLMKTQKIIEKVGPPHSTHRTLLIPMGFALPYAKFP